MRKRAFDRQERTTVTRGVVRSAVGGLVLAELIYGVVLAGLYIGAYLILANLFVWYGDELLYRLLTPFRQAPVAMGILLWLVGAVVIVLAYVYRLARYFQDVTDACAALLTEGEATVTLPTPLHQMEEQLNQLKLRAVRSARVAREAEQRKNDLVVYLAHDLKTPLTSVIGYLTLLRDEPQLSPELRARYTGIALEKAERLEDLVNEFFDITRFNLSHLELEKQQVDLRRMIEQVVSEFQPVLAEKGLQCALELPPRLSCGCDPDKLARVFDNLLRNACHYSYRDTVVRISGQTEADWVTLRFANAGPTIPPEKLGRLFERFFRLDSARSSDSGGAGLGLAIAREIVELHGGGIDAESADEQVVFTVRLPAS